MPIIVDRNSSKEIFEKAESLDISIAIFCTGSFWNTESILLAAKKFCEKYNKESVPVVIATTFTYRHMPQAKRFLYCNDPREGLLSHMEHLKTLCTSKYATYRNIVVLPHLDHADPVYDKWALTVGTQYFSSVMFDAQRFPFEENIAITNDYVKDYGNDVLVEGIMEQLNVEGSATAKRQNDYVQKAVEYCKKTNVDFLVADLGTEQQATEAGNSRYEKKRAREITQALQHKMLVLHGTSCLNKEQTLGLAKDGVIRVNMWTRIVRESGQYAAEKLLMRMDNVEKGVFDAAEANQYIRDNVEKASDIMVEMMEMFGYQNWSD